jgi:hypothetical protein
MFMTFCMDIILKHIFKYKFGLSSYATGTEALCEGLIIIIIIIIVVVVVSWQIFSLATPSISTLGPTKPPFQWVVGTLSLGMKQPQRGADHSFHWNV